MSNTIHHSVKKHGTEGTSNITTEKKPFNPLTPISNADEKGHYSEMLQWSLRNVKDNDIRNIALTGPYGSGKSSILKTFEKNNTNKKLVFLNISLATFKDENIEEVKSDKEDEPLEDENFKNSRILRGNFSKRKSTLLDKQKQLRLIEYSILQQIFYHENESTIPESRFKRIISFSEHDAFLLTLGTFAFAAALLYELFSKHLWGMIRLHPVKSMDITFHMFALLIMLYLGYKFIERTIRPLRSLQFKKFNIQQAEFAVNDEVNKSILNEHLDEILYFFEVTDYSVVVFEDLDRFDQPDIFTKLRELNQLINYSKKIERKIVFIYAVRDDMFPDKNRTKFFDFIIPVIPVIHSENSKEKLRELNNKNNYGIQESLLDDISLYVSDMRMVYNIMNEYYLYHKMLDVKSQEKLLAMILYKNMYPKDFVSLCSRDGILFKVINDKDNYIKNRLGELDGEIEKLQDQLREIENAEPRSETELRKLYIFECLNSHPNAKKLIVDERDYDFKDIADEVLFQALIDNRLQFRYSAANNKEEAMKLMTSFEDIEARVDPQQKYEERLALIRNKINGRIEQIRDEIKLTNERKAQVARSTIKTLIKNNLVETTISDQKQNQLIRTLLGEGHIDEFYMDYVSLFYPGSLTPDDANFLRSVRANLLTDFDHPINSIDNLIKKLSDSDFESEYVLNFSLVNHVLESQQYKEIRNKIFRTLSNEEEVSFRFIVSYLESTNSTELFVRNLAQSWSNIWNFLERRYHAIEDGFLPGPSIDLDTYLKLIIQHAKIEDIKKIAARSELVEYITGQEHFFKKYGPTNRLKQIVKALDIKFKYLVIEDLPNDVVETVYTGNHYEINKKMLFEWFYLKDGFNDDEFSYSNYSRIMHYDDLLPLKKYIDDNLDKYIRNVWLNLEGFHREGTFVMEYFLSSENLSLELKQAIIIKSISSVYDVSKINDIEVLRILLRENKLNARWDNLLKYYELNEKKFDEYLIDFLNIKTNIEELENQELSSRTVNPPLLVNDFGTALILKEEIINPHYYALLKTMSWSYSGGLEFERLSAIKVGHLIESKLEVSRDNLDKLKYSQPNLVIQLLEKDPSKLMRDINDFKFTGEDVTEIMRSSVFDLDQKSRILAETTEFFITNSMTALEAVAEASYKNGQLIVSNNILLAILKCEGVPVDQKISLLHRIILQLSTNEMLEILRKWGKPYDQIRPGSGSVSLTKTGLHIRLADLLMTRNIIEGYKTSGRKIILEN